MLLTTHVVLQLWRSVMDAMDWNKKEELVADQARVHLKVSRDVPTVVGSGRYRPPLK